MGIWSQLRCTPLYSNPGCLGGEGMALKVGAPQAAEIAIASIGRGYDVSIDLRLKYCKGESRLIEIDDDGGIKCDKGERTRFRSDVLSFQQVTRLSYFHFQHPPSFF